MEGSRKLIAAIGSNQFRWKSGVFLERLVKIGVFGEEVCKRREAERVKPLDEILAPRDLADLNVRRAWNLLRLVSRYA